MTEEIINELEALGTREKREVLMRFFKTGKGDYAEGDRFFGARVPEVREVAKRHLLADIATVEELLKSDWHEARLCGLLILTLRFKKAKGDERDKIARFYLSHTDRVNNWDLVDLTAPSLLGEWLIDRPRTKLYELAESRLLWDNRIAIVSTLAFIRANQLDDTYSLATKMMAHPHDLMHKAIGWMLREAGKRDHDRLFQYVAEHRTVMPRTMLRYAIERFSAVERKQLL